MGLFSGLFGSGSETTSNPVADLQTPCLSDIYKKAQQQYEAGQLAPNYFPGQTLTGFDPVRAQGVNIGVDTALGAQTDLAQGQTDLLTNILSGSDPFTQQLANQAAQATSGAFGSAGTLGSQRNYNAANKAAADAILNRQLDASQQVGTAQTNALTPCLLYTSPSPRDRQKSRMPSSA